MKIIATLLTALFSLQALAQEKFPDGTPIPDWFRENKVVSTETLGTPYNIADYGIINDSTVLQTEKILCFERILYINVSEMPFSFILAISAE